MQGLLIDLAIFTMGFLITFNFATWSLEYLRRKLPDDPLLTPLFVMFWVGVIYLLFVGFRDALLLGGYSMKLLLHGLGLGLVLMIVKVLNDYIGVLMGGAPTRRQQTSQPQKG